MVTTFYPPYHFGGDAEFIHQLSNELAMRGHEVEVVHCRDAFELLGGRASNGAYGNHPNVTIHELKSAAGWLSPVLTQQTGGPILKASALENIFRKPFDVIHYHNISLVGGPRILEYGRAIKLYTLHEYWLICPTHMLFKFGKAPCAQASCLLCTVAHGRPPQMWRYMRTIERAVDHVDLFLAPSRFSMQKHREMGLKRPIVELPYFTSRWPLAPQSRRGEESHEEPYFLFVGRLEKIKGLQTLIPAFRCYTKAQLLIVGTGEYEDCLRGMAAGSPHIKFLGRLGGEELRSLYEGAVATIVPSLWYEVFGIVILESFTQRTPVIVRDVGGMPNVVEESGGGLVFTTETELLRAMDRLLEERGLREEMGRRGHRAFEEKWSAGAHIPRYLGLIEAIASCGTARSGPWNNIQPQPIG
ncbi:MAG TPA: glycosyltransferase family 4 protein [Nitrospira sp.]|nr:glycosyltransferase family 4 protein [Nitrospira sp.]